MKSLETATSEILEFGWNNQEQVLIVPTKASSTIVSAILQVNRAISDLTSREDLLTVFRDIIFALNEVLFDQIKSNLIVNTSSGFDLLSDELDYLVDSFREFFWDKNGLNVNVLSDNVVQIKHIKKMFINS